MSEPRTEFGFTRTTCDCRSCSVFCEHMPGTLAPSDVRRIAAHLGYGDDVYTFAAERLLASEGALVIKDGKQFRVPTMTPAQRADGSCIFLDAQKRCSIHAVSPFGCAFVDQHMSNADWQARSKATMAAIYADAEYKTIWDYLHNMGKDALPLETRRYRVDKARRKEHLL